jgi:8-oxo-dGTP pyrophosphatase MutT (NUDIX family)
MFMETPVAQIVEYAAREQIAALPYRVDKNRTMIMLITSRGTGRWVLPKGWVEAIDSDPAEAAAREALEEAGVIGDMHKVSMGAYTYFKSLEGGANILCSVRVYPLHVKRELKSFKEAGQRILEWFSVEDAADAVKEPELAALIRKFGSEQK